MAMKIDHIEVVNLRFEYPGHGGFAGAGGRCTARVTSLVLVHTDTREIGIGTAYSHPAIVHLVVKYQLEPMLRGREAGDVEGIWELMYGLTRWYGRKGAAMSAIGGVDTALWDLRGKVADKPVRALWGGARDACPAYASGLLWDDLESLATEAQRHLDRGFRRMKMRLGRSEAYDTEAVRVVRKAIGPHRGDGSGHDVMVDASMRYHPELARRMGRVLEENGVFWYEEPFEPEQLDAYTKLCSEVDVPVAAGENEFGTQGFDELIRCRAVDIVQPDASRCGGITEVRRVAKHAEQAGLRVAPHTWSDAVAVVANAQVVASISNGVTVELDQTGNPFIDRLLVDPLRVHDGQLQLSGAPGLGIELDQDVIDEFRMANPLEMPEGHYSDMVFGPEHLNPVGLYEEIGG